MSSVVGQGRDETTLEGVGVSTFLADVDRHMLELVDRWNGDVASAARRPIAAGGKRLRPLLLRAARPCALDHDAQASMAFDTCSIRAAAAVELIHTASLVHDDLLDGADVRRGASTIGAAHGRDVAVAAGDLLFSLAFATLVQCRAATDPARVMRAVRVLARAARTLAEGEAMQARQQREPHLAEEAYLERCGAKTGVLFEAALQLGAILGGADGDDVDLLGRFGRTVGIAFQVADDVLDCGTPETEHILGKRPGADLRDGTITLPMLIAVQADPALADVLANEVGESDVEPILQRIRATGALTRARERAHALRAEAEGMLGALEGRFELGPLRRVAASTVDRIS